MQKPAPGVIFFRQRLNSFTVCVTSRDVMLLITFSNSRLTIQNNINVLISKVYRFYLRCQFGLTVGTLRVISVFPFRVYD